MTSPPFSGGAALYEKDYFERHCGSLPMSRQVPERIAAAREVATRIGEALRPTRVFEAGCAIGLLAEELWDQGVAVYGRDLSSYALAQTREDIRPFLAQGSIAEPIEGTYDLAIALDVLHLLEEQDALRAIRHLATAAPQLLFSVSSGKGDPRYHRTVRPLRWWLERLAEAGLAPVSSFDASFIAPHALLVEHTTAPVDPRALMAFEALLRTRAGVQQNDTTLTRVREELASTHAHLAQARATSEALRAELARIRLDAERLRQALQARNEQAVAKQETIQFLRQQVDEQAAAKQETIQFLRQQIDEQTLRIQEQANELRRRDEIETLTRQLEGQAEALEAARRHRDLLLCSTSWRLTAPLRGLVTSLSRLLKRPST